MIEKVKKRYVGQRLDERLVTLFEQLVKRYPRLSMTDFIDMAMKYFVESIYDLPKELNLLLGRYLSGELDQNVTRLYKEYTGSEEKSVRQSKKQEKEVKSSKKQSVSS